MSGLEVSGFYIVSNVFEADFKFDKPIGNFDFFEVKGVWSERKRYQALGYVINYLQKKEQKPFATYTPSKKDNFVLGYLQDSPKLAQFEVKGLKVEYIGKKELPPSPPAYRTLTEFLNKRKYWELKESLWPIGRHLFYPKKWKNLNRQYPGCGLMMFRGPFYRYNVLSDGRIVLTLDTATHYIKSEPFLQEIKRKPRDLMWFREEIESRRKELERVGKKFRGIHFYYSLAGQDVTIDDVDERPISQIPLSKPVRINGQECRTVSEFLKAKYAWHPEIKNLDETQPGLKSDEYTFAPQFLYRNVSLDEIENRILNEQTFLMDTRSRKGRRDTNRPVQMRWKLLQKQFHQHNFGYLDFGPFVAKMEEPLKFPISNHFDKPRLQTKEGSSPVPFEDLPTALTYGLYRDPELSRVYMYSVMNNELTSQFYKILREYAERRFNIYFPDDFLLLEADLSKVSTYFEKTIEAYDPSESFCIAIIEEASPVHDELTTLAGEYSIPIKCINVRNAMDICAGGRESYLENLCASIITRARGIPWVLYDKLNYDSYVAVDIGRTLSEHWAMGIVYDRDGKFEICPGKLTLGEDLNEESIKHCVKEAHSHAPNSDSLIFLRHGEVYPNEKRVFQESVETYNYRSCGIVSIKETVPYRIFREINSEMVKPLSGDYYFLDDFYAVLCGAGGEEYEHGTPKPIVAEVTPIKGEVVPEKVLRDIFYLTYLNWASPRRSFSLPAPLKLAHNLAYELSFGIRREGPPF